MTKKKTVVVAKNPEDASKNLVDAIVTVKSLQDFIKSHGGLERALDEVAKVSQLVEMTGSFNSLRQALEIVGKENAPAQA
jgi:hypothetical protein